MHCVLEVGAWSLGSIRHCSLCPAVEHAHSRRDWDGRLGSSSAHLALMHVPPGVGGQPRVVDAVHQRVRGQPLCNAPRVGHLCRGVEVAATFMSCQGSGSRQDLLDSPAQPPCPPPQGRWAPHSRQATQTAQLPPTCRSMRRLMVFRPRTSSQQSKGPRAEPSAFCAMTGEESARPLQHGRLLHTVAGRLASGLIHQAGGQACRQIARQPHTPVKRSKTITCRK